MPETIIGVDDVLPNHPAQAERDRRTRVWTGDVWKLIPVLRRYRPDLVLAILDTSPSGCLLVGGLDPANRVLWDVYNPLLREAQGWEAPPEEVLERRGAISPLSPRYGAFIRSLVGARDAPQVRIEALQRLGRG
jgi:hypothetical protein